MVYTGPCSLQCPKLGQGWILFTAAIHSELSIDANGINGSMWSWVKDFEELVYTLVCFAVYPPSLINFGDNVKQVRNIYLYTKPYYKYSGHGGL